MECMYKAHHKSSRFGKDIHFIAFDYHTYISRGKPENVKILKGQLVKYIRDYDFFSTLILESSTTAKLEHFELIVLTVLIGRIEYKR